MEGEISWKAAEAEASFLTVEEEGMSKKWRKPSHDSTISLPVSKQSMTGRAPGSIRRVAQYTNAPKKVVDRSMPSRETYHTSHTNVTLNLN